MTILWNACTFFVEISWLKNDLEASTVMISLKVILLNNFRTFNDLWGRRSFYEVVENPLKCMYKTYHKNIMTGSRFRSSESFDFILNDFIDRNFHKDHTLNSFYGHSMTFEVKGHLYRVVDNPVKYIYKIKFFYWYLN